MTSFDDWESEDELLELIRQYVRQAIDEYDFDVDFDLIETWKITTAKKYAGQTRMYDMPRTATVGDPVPKDVVDDIPNVEHYGECNLKFSQRAFESMSDEECRSVIRHELVHVEQIQSYGVGRHDEGFEIRAEEVDTTVHCDQFVPYDYKFVCDGCGELIGGRYRMCKTVEQVRDDILKSECCMSAMTVTEQ